MSDAVASLLFGFGFVAVVEGLVLALAPSHLRAVLELLSRLDIEKSRTVGLLAVTVGVVMVWLSRG